MKKCNKIECLYCEANKGCQAVAYEVANSFKVLKEGENCEYFEKAQIGTYGMRHRKYIEENHEVFFENKLMDGELENYLIEIDKHAMMLINSMWEERVKVAQDIGEIPEDTLEQIQVIESIRKDCEEAVLAELIYSR